MAQVRTRKRGKTYSYIFEAGKTSSGKRKVVEKGGFATKEEAYNAGTEAYIDYKHGNIGITSNKLPLSDYLDIWIEKHAANVSSTSVYQYKSYIKAIKKELGHIVLQELKPRDIATMIEHFYQDGQSYGTMLNKLTNLKMALDYAVYPAELIPFNPIINIKIPKKAPKTVIERSIISYEKLQKLLEADTSKIYQAPLMIAYHTGLRLREIYGLTWEDIDFDNGTISVNKQIKDLVGKRYLAPPKTANSRRIVYIDSQLVTFLKELKARQDNAKKDVNKLWMYSYLDDDGNIYQTTEKQADNIQDIQFICCNAHGKLIRAHSFGTFLSRYEVNAHSFRHTHATMLAEEKAGMKEIAARLGHKKINITAELYTHETDTMRKNAGEIFEKIIQKNADKDTDADKNADK